MFFCIVLLAVCCSCSGEYDAPQAPEKNPSPVCGDLEVTIHDNMVTRTTATDNGDSYSVTWTGTEKISVNGEESQSIEVDAANPKRAVFAFDQVSAPYASVYPAAACMSVSGATGTVFLPSEQKYVEGSFDPDAALMVGYSENTGRLDFKHAVSYILVKITTSDSTPFESMSVSGNLAEAMSGEFSVDFRTLKVSNGDKDASTISVAGGAEGIPSGASVMIAIPSRTYEEGISIALKDKKGQTRISKSSEKFPAEAGVVYLTDLYIDTGVISIGGLKDMPVVPMDPSIWEGNYADKFVMADAQERYCVASDRLELSATFTVDLPCELSVPANPSSYVGMFNTKYYSDSILLPSDMYTCTCSKVGTDGLSLVLEIDQDKVYAASSAKSYVLPLQVSTGGTTVSGVFYVFVPTYTVANGMVTVHLSSYATMDIYYADSANDKAVIYCPGGGYSNTSLPDMETNPVFKNSGVTTGVLWYRRPTGSWIGLKELPLTDVTDALAVLKAHSSEWGGYTKYGTAGRSAGGHLAAVSAAYHKDEFDFQILLYPVITMEPGKTHIGSLKNFLGSESPSRALIDAWSAEKLVTKDTPRAYVGYSTNDSVVPQEYNGKAMCTALQQAGVEHCAKEYSTGGHSINWSDFPSCLHQWLKTF